METLKEKRLREEILKVEIDLRYVSDPDKFLQQLNETLKQFGIDKQSLELIPIFFPEKKWDIPRSTFINLSATKDTCTKLTEWRRDKNNLIVHASDGELLIINETKLDEWRLQQNRKENQTHKRKA